MTEEEFLEKIKQDCAYCGVALEIDPGRCIKDPDGDSNGYFDDTKPKLAFATGYHRWFSIAVHEYNHMCQWAQLDPVWHNAFQKEADDKFWDWLSGDVELSPEKAKMCAMAYMRTELDCDRRVVKMIGDFNLPLDPKYYAQTANAYSLFYHLIAKHRRWYDVDKEPYNIPEIVSQMPEDLRTLNYEEISDEMVTLFETHMPYLLDSPSS